MSEQSDALLMIVTAFRETSTDDLARIEGTLWGNPIICTPQVRDLALADADDDEERAVLNGMIERGLIVVDDHPHEARRQRATRPGYMNRERRRAFKHGKPGKSK